MGRWWWALGGLLAVLVVVTVVYVARLRIRIKAAVDKAKRCSERESARIHEQTEERINANKDCNERLEQSKQLCIQTLNDRDEMSYKRLSQLSQYAYARDRELDDVKAAMEAADRDCNERLEKSEERLREYKNANPLQGSLRAKHRLR